MRNVLITGIPRSGTTLAAALIDGLPDTVCLSEPMWHWHKSTGGILDIGPDPDGKNFAKWLVGDFQEIRRKLLAGEPVKDRRSKDGDAITNYAVESYRILDFTRAGLTPNFILAVKHNGPYLTALQHIVDMGYFTVIAMVRHPVDVIASWQRLSLPVSKGKMHDAARCWAEMRELTKDSLDVLERQVNIYDLICGRLHTMKESIHIISYEAMIANPNLFGDLLKVTGRLGSAIVKTTAAPISAEKRERIISAIKFHGTHYRHFYPEIA